MNVSNISSSVDRSTVRSASKVLLATVALAFLLYLVTLLPGVDRLVPQTPVTIAALIGALVTVAIVGLLLVAAPRLASLTRMVLDGPRNIVESISSVVFWLVVLAAVLVAHTGLAGVAEPILGGLMWLYDGVFLLLALPAVAAIATRLYLSLDPSAELIAEKVAGSDEATTNDESTDTAEGATANTAESATADTAQGPATDGS